MGAEGRLSMTYGVAGVGPRFPNEQTETQVGRCHGWGWLQVCPVPKCCPLVPPLTLAERALQ